MYLTGHGGEEFLKFRNAEELRAVEFAEIIEKMNHPHDDYSILVTLKADGNVEKTVVGSVMESLTLDSDNDAEYSRLKEIFTKDSLQMASFTITEKGYALKDPSGEYLKGYVQVS